jgi:hypothetical protein
MSHLFASYVRDDSATVARLVETLSSFGITQLSSGLRCRIVSSKSSGPRPSPTSGRRSDKLRLSFS